MPFSLLRRSVRSLCRLLAEGRSNLQGSLDLSCTVFLTFPSLRYSCLLLNSYAALQSFQYQFYLGLEYGERSYFTQARSSFTYVLSSFAQPFGLLPLYTLQEKLLTSYSWLLLFENLSQSPLVALSSLSIRSFERLIYRSSKCLSRELNWILMRLLTVHFSSSRGFSIDLLESLDIYPVYKARFLGRYQRESQGRFLESASQQSLESDHLGISMQSSLDFRFSYLGKSFVRQRCQSSQWLITRHDYSSACQQLPLKESCPFPPKDYLLGDVFF